MSKTAAQAADGDMVTMDFLGRIDGEAFDGGSAEGATLVIGKGQFIPGFEEGVAGIKAGEDRVVKATFPADYAMTALAGKTAEFDGQCESRFEAGQACHR